MTRLRPTLGLICISFLSACGGGGGGSAPATTGTSNQANFEATTVKDTYVTFDWELPETDVAPTNGTHFFFSGVNSAPASPASGPQENTGPVNNLTTTLALPDMTRLNVKRVLKAGVIRARNSTHRQVWAYQGNNILLTSYAADGTTALYTDVADTWSAPIALTGSIGSTSILKSFLGFTRLVTPSNLDFSKSWLAGSSYFTRKSYRESDTLFVYDWAAETFDANVTPYPGAETTIEAFFSSIGFMLDSKTYALSDGAVSTVQGARTWVAKSPRPTSVFATDNYAAVFELNGKLYFGGMQRAGARFRLLDGVDRTVVNDYTIRLNSAAAESIKQTVKF